MKRLPWFLVIVAALAIAAIAYAVWHYPSAGVVPAATGAEAWGQMGDYFGGMLNPVLSFCALIALLYTIHQQHQELALTRRELEKTLEELEMARVAQEHSADLLAKQTAMTVTPSLIDELHKSIGVFARASGADSAETQNPGAFSTLELQELANRLKRQLEDDEGGITPHRVALFELQKALCDVVLIRQAYASNMQWIHAALSIEVGPPQGVEQLQRKKMMRDIEMRFRDKAES